MQQKQKNHSRHAYIRALLFFAVIFSVAFLSKSFAAQETLPRQDSIKTCIARIFELDREKIFADVGSQQWYTHAVHFLVLLDEGLAASPAGENDATPQLPKFSPKKVVLQNEFAKWLSSYSILFDDARTSSLAKFSSRVKKKLTASTMTQLLRQKLKLPTKTTKDILKRQGIQSKNITKAEAAFVLLSAAKRLLPKSPEETLCFKRAAEDPELFEETFGADETTAPVTVPDPVASSPDPQNPAPALVTQPNDPTVTAPNPIANLDIAFLSNTPRAGDDVAVSVQARDANNAPVTGQSLILALSTGRDFEKTYALLEGAPGGLYTATVNSTWAGTYRVGVRQGTIAVGTTKSLTFLPADPSTISLKLATPQEKSSSKREAVVSAVLRDSFGNVVDSLARDYRVTTSVGKIKSVEKRGQEIAITAEADAWGVANISVSHLTRSVQDAANTIDVPFSPIVLDIPKGVQTGASFSVPVYIFLPPASGKIGGYRFTLNYEMEDLTLQEVTDGNTNDGFDAPTLSRGDGTIQLAQTTRALPSDQVIHAANMTFLANTVAGSGTIYVPDGIIINDQEKVIALPESSGAGESLRRWWNAVKAAKNLCIDIWIVEGTVSRAEALDDVQKASNMFKKAADASFCPFYMNWTTNFHHISAADWSAKINNGTTTAEAGDDADLRANFAGNAECVQVWYVHDIAPLPNGVDPIALSHPGNGGITISDKDDYDDLTLGHELGHQLSGNDVLDSPDDVGNTQGAKDDGNPMNYDHPGDNFTKAQCDLFKQPPYIK